MRRPLDTAALRSAVAAVGGPWREPDVRDSVGSTNAEAARRPQAWAVVCADHQSSGRGRMARRWEAPPRSSLAVSAVVPVTGAEPAMHGWLPLLTGMAVAHAVTDLTGLDARLKWPNDVLVQQEAGDWRKVGGVLCELLPATRSEQLAVVGVGLNVDQETDELPVGTATSLALCGAAPVPREDLIAGYLARLAPLVAAWTAGGPELDALRERYTKDCLTLGQQVRLHRPDGSSVIGRAAAVDPTGRLLLDTGGADGAADSTGAVVAVDSAHALSAAAAATRRTAHAAGDVVHLRPAPVSGPTAGSPQ